MRPPTPPILCAAGIAALAGALAVASCSRREAGAAAAGGDIHGSVLAVAGDAPRIALPGFTLLLADAGGVVVDRATTDLQGRYHFSRHGTGDYVLRWDERGFAPPHQPRRVVLRAGTAFVDPIEVRPLAGDGVGWIAGSVRLIGGASPWFHDHSTRSMHLPEIAALGADGAPVAQARTNVAGEWLLVGLTVADTRVRATLDAGRAEATVAASQVAAGTHATLTIPDHRPELLAIRATQGGVAVTGGAAAGSAVDIAVTARDLDNDALSFAFATTDGGGTIAAGANGAATWTLPARRGRVGLLVSVVDGTGGGDQRTLWLTSGDEDEIVAGRAVDDDGRGIGDAEVAVGEAKARTDADGAFVLRVARAPRYVLAISARGFAPFSRVLERGARRAWRLTRARSATLDAGTPLALRDGGAEVVLPPNALIDAARQAPAAPVVASFTSLDLARDLPGDGSARDGTDVVDVIAFAAASIEMRDGAGARLDLAPGMEARVVLPLTTTLADDAPPEIALWAYDERDGRWAPDGAALFDAARRAYVGTVKHLATIAAARKEAQSGCLAALVDPALVGRAWARVRDPTGRRATQAFLTPLDDAFTPLRRLPAGLDVAVDLVDDLGRPIAGANVLGPDGAAPARGVVATGGPISEPIAQPEAGACALVRCALATPPWPGALVSSPFLTMAGALDADVDTREERLARGYYAALDPRGCRRTLADWWSANGFDTDGAAPEEARATFLDLRELGLALDAHIRVERDASGHVTRVAAYVVDRGDPDRGAVDPNEAGEATRRDLPAEERAAWAARATSTLCIERVVPDAGGEAPIVAFYTYAGGLGDAPLSTTATLDARGGPRHVPMVCQSCHGSERVYAPADPNRPTADELDLRCSLREIAGDAVRFPARVGDDAARRALRAFDEAVLASSPRAAIRELIEGGVADPARSMVPAGWRGGARQGLYQRVVARSCRGCHAALPSVGEGNATFGALSFASYDDLRARRASLPASVLRGEVRSMPHAEIAYTDFWMSDAPAALATFADPPAWPALRVHPADAGR